jgi:hypothetical protein
LAAFDGERIFDKFGHEGAVAMPKNMTKRRGSRKNVGTKKLDIRIFEIVLKRMQKIEVRDTGEVNLMVL